MTTIGETGTRSTPRPESPARSRTFKVVALSIGNALSLLAGIATGMVASRYLTKHDYATVRQTFLAYEFAAPLLLLGLPNALYYFLPRAQDDGRGALVDNLLPLLGSSAVFFLFTVLGGSAFVAARFDNADLLRTLPWAGLYALAMAPAASIAAALVVTERVQHLAIYNVATSLCLALGGIVAILVTSSYEFPVLARVAVPLLALPIGLALVVRAVPGHARWPRWQSVRAQLHYAAPLGLATMLGSLTLQVHAVVVASLCTPESFAVYINGAIEVPVVGIIAGSIATVIFADMSAACARGDKTAALNLFRKASLKSACLLLPTMFFFLIAADAFIVFMYTTEYRDSRVPFMIYLAVLPARIVVYGVAMMALGMSRQILLRSVFDLAVNTLFCYLLVSLFGYVGAAVALAATLYCWTVPYNLRTIARGFGVPWTELLPWKALAGVAGVSAVAVPFAAIWHAAFPHWPAYARLAVSAVCYGLACGYMLYRIGQLDLPVRLEARLPRTLRRWR